MRLGVIGNGADRFRPDQVPVVKALIRRLIAAAGPGVVVVSGHSRLGGVDAWAEEAAQESGAALDVKAPRQESWHGEYGYRARNLDIAKSDVVHVVVAERMPDGSEGPYGPCYHCKGRRPRHVKSGACWSAIQALKMGNKAEWHVIP